uniref:Ubiquitin carboxyl-terminal hydrolase n=1 Tax=Romanomermis culicivorax TaxID=13658 RepID=A0A915JTJ8_ROMCU
MSLFERSATLYLNRDIYEDSSSKPSDMDSYRAAFDPARYNFSRSIVKSPSLNFSRKTNSNMANGSIIADNNGVTLTSISSSPLSTTNFRSSTNLANKFSDSDTSDQSSSRSRFARMITASKPPLPSIESSIRGSSSSAPYKKLSPPSSSSSTYYDYRSSSSTLPSSSRRYASVERRVPITLASYDASFTDNSSTSSSNRYDYRGVDALSRRFENAMSSTAAALAGRSRSTQGRQKATTEAVQLENAAKTADEIRESPTTFSTHHQHHKSSATSAPPTALYRVKKVAFSVPDVPSYVRSVNVVRENENANEENQKRVSNNQPTTGESPTSTAPISILKTSKSVTLNGSTANNNNNSSNIEMNDESSHRIRSNSNSMISVIPARKNDLLEKDSVEKLGLVGLRNLGNTCFMNSVLQCLSHSKLLREYCINGRLSNEISSSSRMKGMLIRAFSELLNELWSPKNAGPSSYINPEKFKLQIQKFAPRFTGYSQQDAQEFLRYLLQGLHEDVNTVVGNQGNAVYYSNQENEQEKAKEAWRRYLTMDDSKIVDIFVGQLKSELKCTSCGHVSTTYDPFWDLSLPIPQQQSSSNGYSSSSYSRQSSTVTLADCMDAFTKEEILDGDEKPTCEKCKTRRKCTKKFSIQRFPPILVLHLKRFSGERYRSRLSTLIQFPVTKFDLSAYVCQKSGNGPAPRYDLYAVSNHTGTPLMGHYTAYCKRGNNDRPWYLFDDTRVVSVNESCVVSSEAYVLFYEIINDSADRNGNSISNKSTVNGFIDRKSPKFYNSNNSSSSGTLLSRF